MQARFPLIARVASTGTDAANGTATQAGGPDRFLLQANYTGLMMSCRHLPNTLAACSALLLQIHPHCLNITRHTRVCCELHCAVYNDDKRKG